MANKTKLKVIEKPWAISPPPYSLIVKIVQDTKEGVDILNSETVEYFPLMFISHRNLKRFDQPYEVIRYFCKTYGYLKEKVIQSFLKNFPSERANLRKLFAQSLPKRTRKLGQLDRIEDTPSGGYDSV